MTKRWRRRLLLALGGGVLVAATLWLADRLLPPDPLARGPASVAVLDADGVMLRAFITKSGALRLPTEGDAVDRRYLTLLQAYEDHRFAEHRGVDPLALLRAAGQWVRNGRIVSGGSTLTMQTARLLEPRPRGIGAKLLQIGRALQLEERYDKSRILSLYLTLAPFGGNLEGVRSASLAYFGHEPDRLTLGEAALLVALPQSPERLRPDRYPEAARHGRDKVLLRLRDVGILAPGEVEEAMAEPVPDRRLALPFHAPHLAAHLAARLATGQPAADVRTTIDGKLQRAVEALAEEEVRWFSDGADFAALIVDNRSRQIIAYLGSSDFTSRHGEIDLTRATRSPGSTLKPFIYGMAFEDRILHPASLVEDRPMRFGDYAPRNFDHAFQGTVTAREALRRSLNVPAVALLDRIGAQRFVGNLRGSGARLSFHRATQAPSLPVALGGVGISLTDLTMLYCALANGGIAAPLTVLPQAEGGETHRLFGSAASWYVTDILSEASRPEGWADGIGLARDREIAFKTGTSYGFRDAWAMGYSRAYTVGVWVGRADGTPRPGHYGVNTAAPLLLKLFDLLPPEPMAPRQPPAGAITTRSPAALPGGLRHLANAPGALPPVRGAAKLPHILFPPDGATLDWQPGEDEEDGIALKGEGGDGPLLWLIDGRPLATVPASDLVNSRFWHPDGEGFARITLLDRTGRSSSVTVRIKAGQ